MPLLYPLPPARQNCKPCARRKLSTICPVRTSFYNETFSYDPFGNHNSGGTPSGLVTSFSFASNQISGARYDSDGNLLADPLLPSQTNAFDAEGHAVTLEGIGLAYDALGRAVEGAGGAGAGQFLYAPDGRKIAVMGGQTLQRADIPLPGGDEAVYNSSGGFQWYRHADGLGSAPLISSPAGGALSSIVYTPFGFDETGSGTGYRSFTGQKQDTDYSHTGGQYDFLMREYNPIQGRWWTPDPAGLAAVDLANPQSLNRYAYVNGTPLEATDPDGLAEKAVDCFDDPYDVECGWGPWIYPWYFLDLGDAGGGGDDGGGGAGGGGILDQTTPNAPAQAEPAGATAGCATGVCGDAMDFSGGGADPATQIKSLYEQILKHLAKIEAEPFSRAVPGWRSDIGNWARDILKKAGQRQGSVDKFLQRTVGVSESEMKNLLPSPIITVNPCVINPLAPYCNRGPQTGPA
ncbi:MAG: RHS repeat domain-containing protein [Terriglobales bacterium]